MDRRPRISDPLLRALLRALRFDDPRPEELCNVPSSQWRKLLDISDREHLTLALGLRCRSVLPDWVRSRLDKNLADNSDRFKRLQETYQEIAGRFANQRIELAVLKGFSHWPDYESHPGHRPQSDLDLLCKSEQVYAARDVLASLGYEPLSGFDALPIDHLPAMIRKTGWRWQGDYFDPSSPLSVELHFRLWDADTERIVKRPGWKHFGIEG